MTEITAEKGERTHIGRYVFVLQKEKGNNIVCWKADSSYGNARLTFLEACVEYMRQLIRDSIQYITVEDIKGRSRYMKLFILMMRSRIDEMRSIDIIEDGDVLRIKLF